MALAEPGHRRFCSVPRGGSGSSSSDGTGSVGGGGGTTGSGAGGSGVARVGTSGVTSVGGTASSPGSFRGGAHGSWRPLPPSSAIRRSVRTGDGAMSAHSYDLVDGRTQGHRPDE